MIILLIGVGLLLIFFLVKFLLNFTGSIENSGATMLLAYVALGSYWGSILFIGLGVLVVIVQWFIALW